jgi:hypothetical protein
MPGEEAAIPVPFSGANRPHAVPRSPLRPSGGRADRICCFISNGSTDNTRYCKLSPHFRRSAVSVRQEPLRRVPVPGIVRRCRIDDFPFFPGPGTNRAGTAEHPVVSLLHTGETGPVGADPIPGKTGNPVLFYFIRPLENGAEPRGRRGARFLSPDRKSPVRMVHNATLG